MTPYCNASYTSSCSFNLKTRRKLENLEAIADQGSRINSMLLGIFAFNELFSLQILEYVSGTLGTEIMGIKLMFLSAVNENVLLLFVTASLSYVTREHCKGRSRSE